MDNKQYFDEMNILDSDKELRINMCNDLSGSIYDEFQEYKEDNNDFDEQIAFVLMMLLFKYMILDEREVSVDVCKSYIEWKLDVSSSENNFVASKSTLEILNNIVDDSISISDTTIKTLESEYSLSKKRADFIARNITNKYNNINNHNIAVNNGAKYHIWRSLNDGRDRKTHRDANGQTKKINEPFIINGYYLMYPMDGQYGADASEILGCRCVEGFTS